MEKATKILVGLSGGMDSATLLGLLLDQGHEVHCCTFHYGSTHGRYEKVAAANIFQYFCTNFPGLVHAHGFDLTKVMGVFFSNLLQASGREIPEGHYTDESMRKTVVPGRNLIFASIMAGLAESIGADAVALGVHSGDHHIYPDCRPEFVKALDSAVYLSTDRQVQVFAPFSKDDKASILRIGYGLSVPVPYHLTRTCYKPQLTSCGKCGSCNERLAAFKEIGRDDPIPYERL